MSGNKHTDGPWQVNPLGVEFESGSIFADTLANGARRLIATVSIGADSPANARLIAAAPELLESLRQTVAALNGLPCRQQALDDAMRAILKATGR